MAPNYERPNPLSVPRQPYFWIQDQYQQPLYNHNFLGSVTEHDYDNDGGGFPILEPQPQDLRPIHTVTSQHGYDNDGGGFLTLEPQPQDLRPIHTVTPQHGYGDDGGGFPILESQPQDLGPISQPFGSEREQDQYLYPDDFNQDVFTWPFIELENTSNESFCGPWSADWQSLIPIQTPDTPVIHDDIAHKPGQEFRCNGNCRGIFTGPHKCSRRGRSLTIFCRDGDCTSKFTKRHDFNRHCDALHRDAKELLDCPHANCKRVGENGFNRKDNFTQHRRGVHGEDIPKNPVRFGRGNSPA